jgi:cell division control protein 45
MSKSLQKIIIKTGIWIIEDHLVKTLKNLRLVTIKEHPDISTFLHPLALTKLGLFMLTAMKETGRSYLPFVIAVFDVEQDTYLVVGLEDAEKKR